MTGAELPIARELIVELTRRGETVATAESITGGLVLAALTEVPGSSAAVRGGLIVYATDLKASLAGVSEDLLHRDGPVAASTAAAMAEGALARCDATYGVSTTGVAGPADQDGHPPGTLHVAVASPTGVRVASYPADPLVEGDRHAVRQTAVIRALELLRDVLQDGGDAARESSADLAR
jgi:nicotinamide-nucleotide amidase